MAAFTRAWFSGLRDSLYSFLPTPARTAHLVSFMSTRTAPGPGICLLQLFTLELLHVDGQRHVRTFRCDAVSPCLMSLQLRLAPFCLARWRRDLPRKGWDEAGPRTIEGLWMGVLGSCSGPLWLCGFRHRRWSRRHGWSLGCAWGCVRRSLPSTSPSPKWLAWFRTALPRPG